MTERALPTIRPPGLMDFVVGDDFRFIGIVAGLGNMKAVSSAFMPIRSIGVIGRLEGYPSCLFLDLNFMAWVGIAV